MKDEVGVWIDYRQALVVMVSSLDPEEVLKPIKSSLGNPVHYAGAITIGSAGTLQMTTGKAHDRHLDELLNRYLDEVMVYLREAASILILGPGAAKFALQKRLEAQQLGEGIVAIQTADRLTHLQIALEVRRFFAEVHQHLQAAQRIQPELASPWELITQCGVAVSHPLNVPADQVQMPLADLSLPGAHDRAANLSTIIRRETERLEQEFQQQKLNRHR